MEIKTVALIGLGALGIMYADRLSSVLGENGFYVVADHERIGRYEENGVFCNGKRCRFRYISPKTACEPCDLAIFCTKSFHLNEAIADMRNHIGPHTVILSFLNGITSEEIIGAAYGMEKMLYSVVQGTDATRTENRLIYRHMGKVCFGEKDGALTPRVKAVCALFERAGIAFECRRDMLRQLWNKFMLNVGVNQAAAVYATNYGGVCSPGEARRAMIAAMEEVRLLSVAAGIHLTREDIIGWLELLKGLDPAGMPSMRQDALANRRMETGLFCETVIALGEKYQVKTPVNAFLQKKLNELTVKAQTYSGCC